MGSESRSFRVAVMAGNMGKEARPPNSPVGTAICAPGASATHWRATHVNWFTRRGWHKRYSADMREHVLLFCLLGLVLTATILLVAAPGAVTWALAFIE